MKRTLAERFWAKVDRSGGPDACWPWTAALNHYGYPHFRLNGKTVRGNRMAVVLGSPDGRVPPRALADEELVRHGHQCRESGVRKRCVNPGHLTPGDHSANLYDAYDYGEREPTYGVNPWAYKRAKALHLPVPMRYT